MQEAALNLNWVAFTDCRSDPWFTLSSFCEKNCFEIAFKVKTVTYSFLLSSLLAVGKT